MTEPRELEEFDVADPSDEAKEPTEGPRDDDVGETGEEEKEE